MRTLTSRDPTSKVRLQAQAAQDTIGDFAFGHAFTIWPAETAYMEEHVAWPNPVVFAFSLNVNLHLHGIRVFRRIPSKVRANLLGVVERVVSDTRSVTQLTSTQITSNGIK